MLVFGECILRKTLPKIYFQARIGFGLIFGSTMCVAGTISTMASFSCVPIYPRDPGSPSENGNGT